MTLPRLTSILTATAMTLSLLAVSSSSGHATAPSKLDEQRRSLYTFLQAYEIKLRRKVLDRVGPDVARLLIDIADKPRALAKVRIRAVAAVALYPTQTTRDYLRGLLHHKDGGSSMALQLRRQALRSLGYAFGEDALDDILELKTDEDPMIREAVAHALGDTLSARVVPNLQTWLGQEPELFVRVAVDKALSRIQDHTRKQEAERRRGD